MRDEKNADNASALLLPYGGESGGLDRIPTDHDIASPNNDQWPLSERLRNRVC